MRDLELTATSDGDLDLGLAALRALGLNLPDDVHAVDHRAKHDVLAVQMRRLGRADEELGKGLSLERKKATIYYE